MNFAERLGDRLAAIVSPPIKEEREGFETRTYKITSRPHNLDRLEKLLGWASHLGHIGHSGAAKFEVDGDGSGQIDIKCGNREIKTPEDYDNDGRSVEGRFEYTTGLD